MRVEVAQGQGTSGQESGQDHLDALAETTEQARARAACGSPKGDMGLRQVFQSMERLGGVSFAADAEDPEGSDGQGNPEAFCPLGGGDARLVPLPSASLEVFEAPFDPGAQAIPGGVSLSGRQVRDEKPGLLARFSPHGQQATG
jgi:hypothetical protein